MKVNFEGNIITATGVNTWPWATVSRGFTYSTSGGDTGEGGAFIQNSGFNKKPRAVAQFGAGLFDVVDGDASNAANTLTINGGTLDLDLGYTEADGDSFQIFENWTIAGCEFDAINITGTALDEGLEFDTSNLYTTGTLGVIAIPEPSSAMLLALGGLTLTLRRRK